MTALHCQSAYSFNGALLTLDALLDLQQANQMPAILVDRNLHGAIAFYHQAKARQMPVVLGLEVAVDSVLKEPITALLFARHHAGFEALIKLATKHAAKPPLTVEDIKPFDDHLTVVLVPYEGGLKQLAHATVEVHSVLEPWLTLKQLILPEGERYASFKRPQLAFSPLRYAREEDAPYATILSQILGAKSFEGEAHLDQAPAGEALKQFYVDHELTLSFPKATLPAVKLPKDVAQNVYLEALAKKGLERRLAISKGDHKTYQKRLNKELNVITTLGFTDYFLLVWDLMKEARRANILVGPGRGSAPGSLVAYALGITHVDPIEHGLLFERFLNQARQTMPDIDIDFPDDQREHMIRYALNTYGHDRVALLSTFGTFLKRSALKDTARVLNIERRYVDEMSQLIDRYDSVQAMIQQDKDVRNRMAKMPEIHTWLKTATRLEGLPRHVSTHAAGVILSAQPLTHYTALTPGLHDMMATQTPQKECEALGLLKIDFLGLRNLSLIERMLKQINQDRKKPLDLYRLGLNDKKTFEYFKQGSTTGIFQLESEGMRRLVKRMKMTSFEDIVSVLALYRPGPMESIDTFLKRRHEGAPITPLEPQVDHILASTQGILLYQEQIMAIATVFAGYTLEDADLLRRAVSKKDRKTLEHERLRFVKKAQAKNRSETLAQKIYDYIVRFADYGFNKSHSVAYAMVAYWMAYIKAHHPADFLGVMMMQALGNETALKRYIQEAYQHQLTLEGPDINQSTDRFERTYHALIYPLIGVRGLGKESVQNLLAERAKGPFRDVVDLMRRAPFLTPKQLEALIDAGALKSFGHTQQTLKENIEAIKHYLTYQAALESTNFVMTPYDEYDALTLMQKEKTALGLNLTYHPLTLHQTWLNHPDVTTLDDLDDTATGKTQTMLVFVSSERTIQTKQGQPMAFLQCEGRFRALEGILFPTAYSRLDRPIKAPFTALIKGSLERNRGKLQVVVERLKVVDKKP